MAHIIDLKTFTDDRGNLTVIEKVIPFDIKRIFYIYGVDDSTRGVKLRKQYALGKMEHYLSGWKFFKYLAEVFVRRGFKEIHYIKLLHQ